MQANSESQSTRRVRLGTAGGLERIGRSVLPRALHVGRGDGTSTMDCIRTLVAKQLAETANTGIALPLVRRREEGDFIGHRGLAVNRSTVAELEIGYELLQRAQGYG